jgi:hypothetical protein
MVEKGFVEDDLIATFHAHIHTGRSGHASVIAAFAMLTESTNSELLLSPDFDPVFLLASLSFKFDDRARPALPLHRILRSSQRVMRTLPSAVPPEHNNEELAPVR